MDDARELRALLAHHASCRLLCTTRGRGSGYGAEDLNDRLLERLREGLSRPALAIRRPARGHTP